jgi:hypothetical protein
MCLALWEVELWDTQLFCLGVGAVLRYVWSIVEYKVTYLLSSFSIS